MKSAKMIMGMMILALAITACDTNKEKSRESRGARGAVTANGVVSGGLNVQSLPRGYGYQQQDVYVTNNDYNAFQQQIVGFMSAVLPADKIGAMNNNSFKFVGFIHFDQNGAIDKANSKLYIEINDDRSSAEGPMTVNFEQLASGTINGSNVTLNFQDNYGTFTIQGMISGNTFSGTVSYRNSVNVTQGQAPAAGTIGQFSTSTCSVFNCF